MTISKRKKLLYSLPIIGSIVLLVLALTVFKGRFAGESDADIIHSSYAGIITGKDDRHVQKIFVKVGDSSFTVLQPSAELYEECEIDDSIYKIADSNIAVVKKETVAQRYQYMVFMALPFERWEHSKK